MDFKDTLNLPRTPFAMKADLARREPEMLAAWERDRLYQRILAARAGSRRWILHDGPPYANGHIHFGTILNKILKDIVVKFRTMEGYQAPYVPGWDCHGLPIELAVDRALGERKSQMSKSEVRRACRDYAMRFVAIQRDEFRRLGVLGAWDDPYLTLAHDYEAAIARALAAFVRAGHVYRGRKPVHWCPSCHTALAEAEVEHHGHSSPSIYVRFPYTGEAGELDQRLRGHGLSIAIWTTTPWTLPANLAVVLHPGFSYLAIPVAKKSRDREEYFLCARELAPAFAAAIRTPLDLGQALAIAPAALRKLEGQAYQPPFPRPGRKPEDYRVWLAEHVTLETGTGIVHTAPGHGGDDYRVGVEHGLDIYAPVDESGRFVAEVPGYGGQEVSEANSRIVDDLDASRLLLNGPRDSVEHQYPHCWRCKSPVLFRATPQWFARIDHADLRQRALDEIDGTQWIPPWGRNRIRGMIEHRPDWCLSRQRSWGVPIPVFYCASLDCGEPLVDADLIEGIASLFAEHGSDLWFEREAAALLPAGTACSACGGTSFRREEDIVDVWFESGVSWLAVCGGRPELGLPADLYLEGSDQHRGWFHTALLTGTVAAGRAPYKAVLTHGFVVNELGRPYSKSEIEKARAEGRKSEYIPPEEVLSQQGAEILRLWCASEDYRNDVRFSRDILRRLSESYRKLRNTFRFLLGNLSDFDPDRDAVDAQALTTLDRHALAQLAAVVGRVRQAYDGYELHLVFHALVDYCAVDLSAFYLDVLKDRLYCDGTRSPSRRAAQTVLYQIARSLAAMAAPILCFTAEEVWQTLPRRQADPESVHLLLFPELPEASAAEPAERGAEWQTLAEVRAAVLKQLEPFRSQKHHSLDARVRLRLSPAAHAAVAACCAGGGELADLLIVSQVVVEDGAPADAAAHATAVVEQAGGEKCPRCWKFGEAPSGDRRDPRLCRRCAEALGDTATLGDTSSP